MERLVSAASDLKWKSMPSITDESSAHTELPNNSYLMYFSFNRISLCIFHSLLFPALSEFVFPSVHSFLFLILLSSNFVLLTHFSVTISLCREQTTHCPEIIFTSHFLELQLVQEQAIRICLIPPT